MKTEDCVLVPRYLLRTLRPEGYFNRFYDIVQASGLSHVRAFEAIHDEQVHFLGMATIDNYESFKSSKNRFIKRRGLVRLIA